jgi:hypothetical protein
MNTDHRFTVNGKPFYTFPCARQCAQEQANRESRTVTVNALTRTGELAFIHHVHPDGGLNCAIAF